MPILVDVERFIAIPLKLLCFGLTSQSSAAGPVGAGFRWSILLSAIFIIHLSEVHPILSISQ